MSRSYIHQNIYLLFFYSQTWSVSFFLFFFFQLAIAKNNIIKLQEENHQLRSENTLILMKTQHHLEVRHSIVHCHLTVFTLQLKVSSTWPNLEQLF